MQLERNSVCIFLASRVAVALLQRVALTLGAIFLVLCASMSASPAPASHGRRIVEIGPSDAGASCREEFVEVATRLLPGDELVLHGGTYSQNCRRRISNLHGTASRPIIIRAAQGEVPLLTRPLAPNHDYPHNNLEIQDSSHVTIRGLRLLRGNTGLRFLGFNRHINLEHNEIAETANNGLAMNDGDTDRFVIRGNHIHDTGLLLRSAGTTEGEGIYMGCNHQRCIASNHLVELNHIHDLRGTSDGGNDGIEIKPGSYGITVRDNVIHDTVIGTRFPCIFVYGGGLSHNIVEGNVIWRCGEGIQVVSDALIRNNLIVNSDIGISAGPHVQVPRMKDITIVNNTLYGHRDCLRARWDAATNMTLANNALYCPGGRAVDATGLGGPGRMVTANFIEGAVTGGPAKEPQFHPGGSAGASFVNVETLDFWLRRSSVLIGAASARLTAERDFNGTLRRAPYDVGAYQTNGNMENPGWRVGPNFRPALGVGN